MNRLERIAAARWILAGLLCAAVYLMVYTDRHGLAVVALVASAYAGVYLLAERDG